MCFNSSYYFELIKREFSLYKEAQTPQEKEFLGRNIISRGYYTVLLHCKYVLNITDLERYSTDTHKKIISEVVNSQVQNFFKLYKKLREYADYYKDLKPNLRNEIFDKSKLEKFIKTISFLLNFDESKLRKSI